MHTPPKHWTAGGLTAALAVSLLLAAPGARAADPPPSPTPTAVSAEAAHSARFEGAVRAFEAQDKRTPPPTGATLFVGSSSIERWKTLAQDFPDTPVLNRGIGATYIADAAFFADRLVIPYKPRLVILGAGTNDLHDGKTPEQVLADFQAFVAKVRAALPDTRIAFLGINPAPSRWAERDRQQAANRLIQNAVAAGKNMDYIPLWDVLLGPDGTPREDLYVADRLHPSAAGYKIRADVVRPHLKSLR